jgi:pimeloyl-ACP methyl ester carboxylesterase
MPVAADADGAELSSADHGEFDLYYVRSGRKSKHPLVIIPGGPGAASVALYRGLRRRAAVEGLDVIMIEHRGVGLSRHDDHGADLPPEALTISQVVDDVIAVLHDAKVGKAVLYGTSYGSYIAAGVGVRYPGRVHAMILDSPLLAADDIEAVRLAIRRLMWDGEAPAAAGLSSKVRKLVDDGVLTPGDAHVAAVVYGLAGPGALERQLDLLLQGRQGLWYALEQLSRALFEHKTPFHHEPDLVGRIGYRELNYGAEPDGKPLDPSVAFREFARGAMEFESEPFDFRAEMPKFNWPTVVVSGGRDLITPLAVATEVASLIPGAVLVDLTTAGHSAVDFRERAALQIAKTLYSGEIGRLPARASALDAAPGRPGVRMLVAAIAAAAVVESVLPAVFPRLLRHALSAPRA